jgi:hypothetical protein
MADSNPTDVAAAFEMLLEEIEEEVAFINQAGAQAFAGGDYAGAQATLGRAHQVTAFRDKVAVLRREWEGLAPAPPPGSANGAGRAERRNLGRVSRGVRTPESAYYRPILAALVDLGGSAPLRDVLARVERAMKPVLSPVDYEPLSSNPDTPRWYNAAQWARNAMVHDGLLEPTSRRGWWAISAAGRAYLAEHKDGTSA